MEDERFKEEMIRMMGVVIQKLGEHDARFDNLERDVSEMKQEVRNNSQKLDTLTGQFTEVTKVVIKESQRITKLETEVSELQSNIH